MGPELRFPRETQSVEEAGQVQLTNNQSHTLARTRQSGQPSPTIKKGSVIAQKTNTADYPPDKGRNSPRESPLWESSPPLTNAEMWNVRRHLFKNCRQDVEPYEPICSDLHISFQDLYNRYVSSSPDSPLKGVELYAAVNQICPYTGRVFNKVESQFAQTHEK